MYYKPIIYAQDARGEDHIGSLDRALQPDYSCRKVENPKFCSSVMTDIVEKIDEMK